MPDPDDGFDRGGGEVPVPGAFSAGSEDRLGRSLAGPMPCVQCKYDLQGQSVIGVCPECGTAVRATILAVVDPLANELKPISHPTRVAFGLVLWVGGFCLAMLAALFSTIRHLLVHWQPGPAGGAFMEWWGLVIAGLVLVAGSGALMISKPHADDPRRLVVLARLGAVLHVVLAAIVLRQGVVASWKVTSWGVRALWEPGEDRALWRLAACVVGLLILICMRPAARALTGRSLAIRTGRVDRQTMLATAAAIVVLMIGDALAVSATHWQQSRSADTLVLASTVVMTFGVVLITLGIVSSTVDAVRIARAIMSPGPSIEAVLGEPVRPVLRPSERDP